MMKLAASLPHLTLRHDLHINIAIHCMCHIEDSYDTMIYDMMRYDTNAIVVYISPCFHG